MKRFLFLLLLVVICFAVAFADSGVSTWTAFKASTRTGESTRSQAVNMGDNSYVVVNRSIEHVCTGDCPATDAVTLPGTSSVLTDSSRLWKTGAYGYCQNTCGSGIQSRSVLCVNESGDIATGCQADMKPEASITCEDYSGCIYAWAGANFGLCSNSCGSGSQIRDVTCLRSDGTSVADAQCVSEKPVASQGCFDVSGCSYAWIEGGFGTCSNSCGEGTQTQTLSCRRSDGAIVDNSLCPIATRPATSQTCSANTACSTLIDMWDGFTWNASKNGNSVATDYSNGVSAINASCSSACNAYYTQTALSENRNFPAGKYYIQVDGYKATYGGLLDVYVQDADGVRTLLRVSLNSASYAKTTWYTIKSSTVTVNDISAMYIKISDIPSGRVYFKNLYMVKVTD